MSACQLLANPCAFIGPYFAQAMASGVFVPYFSTWMWDFIKDGSLCIREDSCECGTVLDLVSQARSQV